MESRGGLADRAISIPRSPIMDMSEFDKNRAAFPPEDLIPYRGKYVVWSPDGKRIIAADEDPPQLDDRVRELGYDLSDVVFSSVPDADSIIGGAWVQECVSMGTTPPRPASRENDGIEGWIGRSRRLHPEEPDDGHV
jgi:hypothetical protein